MIEGDKTSTKMIENKLILVDGSYYLFRAYHGMPELKNSKGEPTGAIYGVINMLRKLLAQYRSNHCAVIFDDKGSNFRHDIYPQYKANRPPMPADLVCQITPIKELIQALGLPLLIIERVEADDVIATLTKQAYAHGFQTYIASGDKDLAQLVNERITLLDTMNNNMLDIIGVKKKYGIPPELIGDYLALTGDNVDNIPGIPKVGPKTAVKWLLKYGSLDEIVNHADDIGGKVGENLRANLEKLPLFRTLVTLKEDVKLDVTIKELLPNRADISVLKQLYTRWDFKSWLGELDRVQSNEQKYQTGGLAYRPENQQEIPQRIESVSPDSQTRDTQYALDKHLEMLEKADLFALSTISNGTSYMDATISGLSFAVAGSESFYVPLNSDNADLLARCHMLLENESKAKLGHNLKHDKHLLANIGINLLGIKHDCMLQSYMLDSTQQHALEQLGEKLDIEEKSTEELGNNTNLIFRLHNNFWPKICKNKRLKQLYEEVELPLLSVLCRMEQHGVAIDSALLKQHSYDLGQRIANIREQAQAQAKEPFNLGSPKQVQAILYEKMGLTVLAKTPKGQPSTAESVLKELARDHELPRLILECRRLEKLKSTYTDRLPEQVNAKTKRVHTSYHQAVTSTGRLSSSDPNLQNIPIRTEEGRRIRQAFISTPGYVLLAADYSQIELRIMAHLSQDKRLIDAFAQQVDCHKKIASEVFNTPIDKVDSDQRRTAKAINFGLIYGMSAFGLAKQLHTDQRSAKNYINLYFQRYPAVKSCMDNIRSLAKQQGFVETVFGRRLFLPDINARNATRRKYAERAAINAPMQGTAADIIKYAMIDIDQWLGCCGLDARLIMQVHDELVFEIRPEDVDKATSEIRRIMTCRANLLVPLEVEIGVGKNWDIAH